MAEKPGNRIQLHSVKYSPPPSDLPVYGAAQPGSLTVMGRSTYAAALEEQQYVYGILEGDRAAGVHVLGRAGAGKTKLLESMLRQDVAAGRPFAVVDASGDLASGILSFLDEGARARVAVLGTGAGPGVSLMHRPGDELHFADTLAAATAEYLGASFDPQARAALSEVLGAGHFPSLAEFARALPARPELEGVRALLGDLLDHPTSRAALSGATPIAGSLVAVLPVSELGHSRARALAHLVTDAVLWAREREQRLLPLYVDGLEILGGRGGVALLRDARVAGIAPVLAHRTYADLSEGLLAAISATVGTEVAFRLAGEDAPRARNEFAQTFDVRDFLVLATRQCYVRLQIRGNIREPFSAETLPLVAKGE